MEEYRYVWLNIQTGKFSDSWKLSDNWITEEKLLAMAKDAAPEWKLIKYLCLNQPDFEFFNLMTIK